MKWKGIKAIREEAIRHLVETEESGYLFYSAPEGYEPIMSGVAIVPPTWRRKIKDYGFRTGEGYRDDRVFERGFDEGSGGMVTDDEEPVLELVEI
ncbi:hypothetical protein KAR91_28520 [Candidatus Pacearchaeota archaeon]|nr:hypothetical protein [Candidatus Pacearchaeota archaeon]